jgi:hypothetical protein
MRASLANSQRTRRRASNLSVLIGAKIDRAAEDHGKQRRDAGELGHRRSTIIPAEA